MSYYNHRLFYFLSFQGSDTSFGSFCLSFSLRPYVYSRTLCLGRYMIAGNSVYEQAVAFVHTIIMYAEKLL